MLSIIKNKKGTILTEALISMFILGTLFVSIATAVTVSISNTKKLQEVNETSIFAQELTDCMYSIAKSDSTAFFEEIKQLKSLHDKDADSPSAEFEINVEDLMYKLNERAKNDPNILTMYDLLNLDDTDMTEYSVRLYLLPSYDTNDTQVKFKDKMSVNYFISYNPLLTSNEGGGRIFNASLLPDIYTFKLVVSKTVNNFTVGTTNYTQTSPASITYIFQISSNGG